MTVADINITWVNQSLDSVVNQYVRASQEIRFGGILDIIKYNTIQIVVPNYNTIISNLLLEVITQFESTKEVITQYRKNKEDPITNVVKTQSLVIKSIWEHGMKSASQIWFKSVSKLPKNIYNFSIHYINNSLKSQTKMHKWAK